MDKEYLIHNNPLKALLIFAIPMMLGNLFQQIYIIADSIIVGRLIGEDALAAIGASYALTNVFICVAIGGGVGAAVIIGRYFGAHEYQKLKLAVRTALLSFLIISIILGIIGYIYSKDLMIILDTPKNILNMSVSYLDIYFLGLPFLFMFNVLSAMFNALGHSRTPLYLLIISSIINITIGIYLVKFLGFGIMGVAWGTLIAQAIAAISAFILLHWEINTYPTKSKNVFNTHEFKIMSMIAAPSILQQSTIAIGMLLVQSVVNSFGSEILAGFSAAMRLESFCLVPMIAMGNAMSAYTAQNLGANNILRVRQGYAAINRLVFIFAFGICLLLELFHTELITIFLGTTGSEQALSTGASYLKFMGWFFVLIGLKMAVDGLLRGAGAMKTFTLANMVNLAIRVCFAIIFAPLYGIAMVWYVVPLGWFMNFIISFYAYHTGKWQKITLV